jgi:hypothetical protein
MSGPADGDPILDYASAKTPKIENKPRHFRVDFDHRRNLRSLIVLIAIGVVAIAVLLYVVLVVVH